MHFKFKDSWTHKANSLLQTKEQIYKFSSIPPTNNYTYPVLRMPMDNKHVSPVLTAKLTIKSVDQVLNKKSLQLVALLKIKKIIGNTLSRTEIAN